MTAREIIMEGNEGYSFIDVINNLTEDQIIDCMHEYTRIKCKELLEIVAEKAKIVEDGYEQYDEYWLDLGGSLKVDKNSILNAVDLKEFIK